MVSNVLHPVGKIEEEEGLHLFAEKMYRVVHLGSGQLRSFQLQNGE